jgi:hypothetical protein
MENCTFLVFNKTGDAFVILKWCRLRYKYRNLSSHHSNSLVLQEEPQ